MKTINLPAASTQWPKSIQSLGVGAVRFQSGAMLKDLLFVSQGASLAVWSTSDF
jgi:hypothetical protein